MEFDIIEITEEEVAQLAVVQQKLLRTAQQKKNELQHKLEQQINEYKWLLYVNGTHKSSLLDSVQTELTQEYEYQVEILKEQLLFNMNLKEPTHDGETGGSGSDTSGYVVDYELSYLERYIEVRDYYLAISDPDERIALLAADEVAQNYLGSYYNTLFNYLVSFT